MWLIFKILNLAFLLVSAYIWFTSLIPIGPMLLILNIGMIICLSTLGIPIRFGRRSGIILLALIALVLWTVINESAVMGMVMLCMYTPVLYLIQLPRSYQADLLWFVAKWLAILLIPSLIIYWIGLISPLPGFGKFVHPNYVPYINHIFYIKSTYDGLAFERFNAFFLEPGHLAMSCEFILFAYRYDFKRYPLLWIMLIAIVFSFSLAGYLLTFIGFVLLKANNLAKVLTLVVLVAGVVVVVQNYSGGDNIVNELIIDRLKYDESKGIQGNNRFFHNTDFEFDKAMKNGDYWQGVNGKANMDLIGGAGFKIYILKHGLIGILIVLAFYLSLIPSRPDWHFTLSFLFILSLCFIQNSYPGWYSWLLPYVIGLNLNSRGDPSDI